MIWILSIVLGSGLAGPVQMDREPCLLMAAAVEAGEPVLVETADGRMEIVVAAKCTEQRKS